MDFAFREDHSAAADLDLTSGGGAAFTAVRAAVSVQMGENQGRATHFFALDDLTVIAVFDEAVEIAVVGQCAVGSAGRGFFIDVIERRKVSRVAERVIGIARLVERERLSLHSARRAQTEQACPVPTPQGQQGKRAAA